MSVFRDDLFAGQTVLVTGGATGIGFAISHAFAAHGARVHILSRNEANLAAACKRINAEVREHREDGKDAQGRAGGATGRGATGAGGKRDAEAGPSGRRASPAGDERDAAGKAAFHVADVRDADRLREIAAEIGPVDVLVNAAAGNFPSPFSALSANAWDSVLSIVLGGTVNATRAFGEPMVAAERGCILNIVAGYAWTGAPGVSHSGAAKAGVLNLTKSLAVEWAPVRCNAVSPGPIGATEGMKRLGDDLGLADAVVKSVPLGRMGDGGDIADACLYLASPAADFVTGTCLVVDGGQDAKGPFGDLLLGM